MIKYRKVGVKKAFAQKNIKMKISSFLFFFIVFLVLLELIKIHIKVHFQNTL